MAGSVDGINSYTLSHSLAMPNAPSRSTRREKDVQTAKGEKTKQILDIMLLMHHIMLHFRRTNHAAALLTMPKITPDKQLQAEVKAFVLGCNSPNAAAGILGVHRSTFWRFVKNGCALAKTRTQLREGLKRQAKNETQSVAVQRNAMAPGNDEVAEIRRFCNSLLALLDERDRRANTNGLQAVADGGH